MRRTEWLQETRKMRFEEAYARWEEGRLTQEEAARLQQQEAAEHDSWLRREVQIGPDAANAGDVVSAEKIEAEAVAWRAETRRKMARR